MALAALLLLAAPAAAQGQASPPIVAVADPALRGIAEALIPILKGEGDYDGYFAASFRAQVPRTRFAPVLDQLRQALGEPVSIERLTPQGAWRADLVVGYERGTATIRLAADPAPPHAVSGLLVTGTAARDDSFDKLAADVRALPGTKGLGIYALGDGAPEPVLAIDAETPAPLGSAFKLWVLAEAARQVAAGQRRWTDVVPLGGRSLPSGITQGWPAGTPMTLQALATLMISISDNTAADTLMTTLGRAAVDRMATTNGGATPVLTTREAFVLKGDPALAARWAAATPAGRREVLRLDAGRIAAAAIDPMMFAGKPLAIDSIEWFASPAAMARLLDRLRAAPAPVAAILAVNHGADDATAARFAYLGYKGGSEPGVITLDFLAQTKAGHWYAVAGSWHRSDDAVGELRFTGLMTRALALVAAR